MLRKSVPIALFFGLILLGCSSQTISSVVEPSVPTISADELKLMVDDGQDFLFLDVRESAEIERDGTLSNYISIPIGQLQNRLTEIPKDKKVVVACERGVRAARGAALLQQNGYKDVVSMGLAEYRAKGYPLVHPHFSH